MSVKSAFKKIMDKLFKPREHPNPFPDFLTINERREMLGLGPVTSNGIMHSFALTTPEVLTKEQKDKLQKELNEITEKMSSHWFTTLVLEPTIDMEKIKEKEMTYEQVEIPQRKITFK